jgi:hypothetical protein
MIHHLPRISVSTFWFKVPFPSCLKDMATSPYHLRGLISDLIFAGTRSQAEKEVASGSLPKMQSLRQQRIVFFKIISLPGFFITEGSLTHDRG